MTPDRSTLRDKVALITGGAGGLGRATALALAEAGAEIVIADVDEDAGRATAEQVGGHFVAADVADHAANVAMVDFATQRCGGLDLAFLNAGLASGTAIGHGLDVDRYRRVMGVNLDGVVYGTDAVLPALRARGGGSIVATASLAGLAPVPMDPIYAANKHAVVGLTRSLGPALAAERIRFNAVCPGFAVSAMTEPIADALKGAGLDLIPAETVAETVVRVFAGDATGECWFVQLRREPDVFRFRNVPGPGAPAP